MRLPWYMKSKGTTIEFHWLWVLWQKIKHSLSKLIVCVISI